MVTVNCNKSYVDVVSLSVFQNILLYHAHLFTCRTHFTDSLWPVWIVSITAFARRDRYYVKWGWPGHQHCGTVTADPTTQKATKWTDEPGASTTWADSRPGQDGARLHPTAHHSRAIKNLRLAYFWNFPLNIFGLWLTWVTESKIVDEGGTMVHLMPPRWAQSDFPREGSV